MGQGEDLIEERQRLLDDRKMPELERISKLKELDAEIREYSIKLTKRAMVWSITSLVLSVICAIVVVLYFSRVFA